MVAREVTFRPCEICGERFCRIDPDYRSGRCTRLFCSDCIDAVLRGENPQHPPAVQEGPRAPTVRGKHPCSRLDPIVSGNAPQGALANSHASSSAPGRKTTGKRRPNLFAQLDAEFLFTCDAAATATNAKCHRYFGPDSPWVTDALAEPWNLRHYFLNPPYSQTRAFIAKAAAEAARGSLVVCLVAAGTDTRWWHDHVYDCTRWQSRPGVEVRFLRGRLRFVGAANSAPFPSAIVIFGPDGRGLRAGTAVTTRSREPGGWPLLPPLPWQVPVSDRPISKHLGALRRIHSGPPRRFVLNPSSH